MLLGSAETYYNALDEKDQYILKAAALLAISFDERNVVSLVYPSYPKVSATYIGKRLKEALEHGFLTRDSWSGYTAHYHFLAYVYPELGDLAQKYAEIKKRWNYSRSGIIPFRDCLYTLLYGTSDEYKRAEETFRIYADLHKAYREVISNPAYAPYMDRIDTSLLVQYMKTKVEDSLDMFSPSFLFKDMFREIESRPDLNPFSFVAGILPMLEGNFAQAKIEAQPVNELRFYWLSAMEKVSEGKMEEAFSLFDKGLKIQRRELKGTCMPQESYASLYYLIVLMSLPMEKSYPLFQQILKWHAKAVSAPLVSTFVPAIHSMLKEDEEMNAQLLKNEYAYRYELIHEVALLSIPVFYLCQVCPNKKYIPYFQRMIEYAYQFGHLTTAYEAAYALWKVADDEVAESIYRKIAAQVNFPPALSRLKVMDAWEKSLHVLLGLSGTKKKGAEEKSQSGGRVVYYFNPANLHLQPVLQKQQAKGWSKGRNIALKTFALGETEYMTEQDRRVTTHIYHDKNYYHEEYGFLKDVFLDLVGHPYVFLNGTDDVPVSFVLAKPQIHIEKKKGAYTVASNIKLPADAENIILQKETNTQYKVLKLTVAQRKIIRFINDSQIRIPEEGKDLLTQLSANLSAGELEVHTTLKLSGKEDVPIKEIAADNRIRIQLLPFGDGLKAELYSKPFGDTAPYCKPGKGGKILLRNKEDRQEQVRRNFLKEQEHERLLMEDLQSLESIELTDGLISFGDPLDSLYLLEAIDRHQDLCVVEWPEGVRLKLLGKAGTGNLNLKVKSGIEWFDLEGELKISEKKVLTLQQLLALSQKSHGRFIELSPGEYVALSEQLKKYLNDLHLFASASKKGLKINRLASLALDGLFDEAAQLKSDPLWKEFKQKVKEGEEMQVALPATLQAELRPYQEDGFRWMARLASWGAGVCLADDMGLGKTIQTLSILLHRMQTGPALVVCPVSVMGNWVNEINRFAPSLKVKLLSNANRENTIGELQAGEVLVISYGLLLSEAELFSQATYATVVLDEAHTIKNYSTKTSKATMALNAGFRIALTGTPVQNHLGEIWNLFHFVNPGLLGTLSHFQDTFVKNKDDNSQRRLRKLISPFILRRTKTRVLDELPPKTEIIRKITLSEDEMAYYELLRRQALEKIEGDAEAGHIQILAEITRLRQACCNPRLVDPELTLKSSKMDTFLDIVDELIDNNHRALVFSQFVSHLDLVRKELDKKNIRYQYLDGSTSQPERIRQVAAFQEGVAPLFLISLKAGGLGLNLTMADYVIHLDPWWNPAVEDQASDRTHRIGQQRPVTVYRLVTEQTIEEKIIRLHNTKRDMAETLLEGSDRSATLSAKELVELMREGNL